MNSKLFEKSIDVILKNQSAWGSYIASPGFPTYFYSWLRDGSYIAHAMDRVGQYESSAAFFRWVGRAITRYAGKVDEMEKRTAAGQPVDNDLILHTRFTLEGLEGTLDDTWGNFQIDGYGTWLWALASHARCSGDNALLKELQEPIQVTLHYLSIVWQKPNYDCWEEHPEYLHPYTLACVYGGLKEMADLTQAGKIAPSHVDIATLADEVRQFILRYGVVNGRLVKHIAPASTGEPFRPITESAVDSSLLGMAFPFNVLQPDDPLMAATVEEIEATLHRPGGGVYRFINDVYFGGGEWLLLAAWLGIHYLLLGKREKAVQLMEWMECQADSDGNLPEQVCEHMLNPAHYDGWVKKWGPIASPLLWSHAMYLILATDLQETQPL